MIIAIITGLYIVASLVCALTFYAACVVSARKQ